MKGFVLEASPLIFVLAVDRIGETPQRRADFVVGNDPPEIEAAEQRRVGRLLKKQLAPRCPKLIAEAIQLVSDSIPRGADDATNERLVGGGP